MSRCRAAHQFYDAFLRGGEQAGFPVTPDHNGYQQEGMHVAQAFIHRGVRWSAARSYLRPAGGRPNLTVLTRAMVEKIVVRDGAATGISVRVAGEPRFIAADREMIVCAGAIGSPKLLMLSGIGPVDELTRHGIPVTAEAAQVGQNLQNHPGVDVQFGTADEDSLTSELHLVGRAKLGAERLLLRRGWARPTSSRPGPSCGPATTWSTPTCNASSSRSAGN